MFLETPLSKEILPAALTNLLPSLTAFPELYSDATLEAIAASLDALVSSNFPTLDDNKSQQYQVEHEFLQLEKLKQLCLAEELEWERLEIQRYREQEQLIVQKELEELQSIKHQLLIQQEEEHKAHLILQQETFAQQQVQLQQIHQLQRQLQQQLEEQKISPYGFQSDSKSSIRDNGQYWPVKDDSALSFIQTAHKPVVSQGWHTAPSGFSQHSGSNRTTEQKLDSDKPQPLFTTKDSVEPEDFSSRKMAECDLQTDDEDEVERPYAERKRKSRRSVDSCVQTDDEDQDEWEVPVRTRRRSRSSRVSDGERVKGSKVSSIAIQTVAEISVQTDCSGTLKRSPVRAQVDTTVDVHRARSDSDLTTERSRRSTPVEVGVNTHLKTDGITISSLPRSSKSLYSPVSPVSPGKGSRKMLTVEAPRHPGSPRSLKSSQRSLSDPKCLSPTPDERMYQYSDTCSVSNIFLLS